MVAPIRLAGTTTGSALQGQPGAVAFHNAVSGPRRPQNPRYRQAAHVIVFHSRPVRTNSRQITMRRPSLCEKTTLKQLPFRGKALICGKESLQVTLEVPGQPIQDDLTSLALLSQAPAGLRTAFPSNALFTSASPLLRHNLQWIACFLRHLTA